MWITAVTLIAAVCTYQSGVHCKTDKEFNRLWPLENSEADGQYQTVKPFHAFSDLGAPVAPQIRPDGTTKSREPIDTLLPEGPPGFEEGFTSLADHLKETKKTLEPADQKDVGNLHPEEVYYADDDMLIIKGGGFERPTFEEPNQFIQPPEEQVYDDSYEPQPPNAHDEYNGNIPTIVEAPPHFAKPTSSHKALGSTTYPLALFVPARYVARHPQYYYAYAPVDLRLRYYLQLPPLPYWGYMLQPYVYRPPSLIDDTRVNFVEPLPQINPDAEILEVNQDSRTSNHNRHPSPRLSKPRL